MIEDSKHFFVITGGPGSGKTILLEALQRAGYARTVEAGRGIIQDQVAIGGQALPWNNRTLFAELMLSWDMRSYRDAAQLNGPVFFDRGVVDVLGYLRLMGGPAPAHVERAVEAFRYNRRAFVMPPWEEIYKTDRERQQDFAEAVRTCEALAATYAECGYELVEVPRTTVKGRMRFVLDAAGILAG